MNLNFLRFLEVINSIILILILIQLFLIFFFNLNLKKYLLILDIVFVFFLILELSIKFYYEDDKEFIKKHWLEIFSLLPFLLILRIFYITTLLRPEKEIEATNTLIHVAEKFGKEHKVFKLLRIIHFIETRPVIARALFRLILNLKRLKFRKSAFSLDLETIIKFILLITFLFVIVLMLIKLKDSKLIFYLINF